MNLHLFTVSRTPDDARITAQIAHQYRDRELGKTLRLTNVFDTEADAETRLAVLIAETGDNPCAPGHECGRCRNWPPKVYEVTITVAECST